MTSNTSSLQDPCEATSQRHDVAGGPWRRLPAGWTVLRERLLALPIGGLEQTALEVLVLAGVTCSTTLASQTQFPVPDRLAATRLQWLLASFDVGECLVVRRQAGAAHRWFDYTVCLPQRLSPDAIYAVGKEHRRLEAGERWLAGAREAEPGLAAALWRGMVMGSPPLKPLRPGVMTWRVAGRSEAGALGVAFQRLSYISPAIEKKHQMWRVHVPERLLAAGLLGPVVGS